MDFQLLSKFKIVLNIFIHTQFSLYFLGVGILVTRYSITVRTIFYIN